MSPPNLYQHQLDDVQFILERPRTFNTSDPGTGKTRTLIEVIRRDLDRRPAIVIAPKSILQASWGADIRKFAPELDYEIADPKNRMDALRAPVDIVLTNHDAVIGILKSDPHALSHFQYCIIDESTAYKNGEAQRSKAAKTLTQKIPYRTALSGTPAPNTVLDLWHQLLLVDGGARLGHRFFAFRSACCTPTEKRANGITFKTWTDKPGIQTVIAQQIADITIRRTLESCLDIPPQQQITYRYGPNKKVHTLYRTMIDDAVLEIEEGRFAVGIHAASQTIKALQILSGAVYDSAGETSFAERTETVEKFQKGEYQVLFAHPQSAGHGLTLTKATTVIWASPTYNLEHYLQFNRRIYRAGQTAKTEIINVEAENTIEQRIYSILNQKREVQNDLLEYLNAAA
jgi:SNF2 family DNA or RNA helicase